MEIAAGDDVAAVAEHQRVIRSGVRFNLQHARGVSEIIEAGAHDLRHATHRVGVLHPAAVSVRAENFAAVDQRLDGGGHRDLPVLAARLMNARVVRFQRAFNRLQRQRARYQPGGHQVFRLEQAAQRQRGRHLGAVKQRQTLFRAEHEGFQPNGGQAVARGDQRALDANLAFAQQHQREMSERRQIAGGADGAFFRNAGHHARVKQRKQRVDQRDTHAGMAARQADDFGRHHQTRDVVGQQIAQTHAVRQHQITLQIRKAGGGNLRLRQLAEAGIDAVHHLAGGDNLIHGLLRAQDSLLRLLIERERHAALIYPAQRGKIHFTGNQAHRLSRT